MAFSSIGDFITKVTIEPNTFNAIGVNTLLMNSQSSDTYSSMPFKIHSVGPCDKWPRNKIEYINNFKPKVDTLQNTVKLWKHTNNAISFSITKTINDHESFVGVSFLGRRVYPYNLVSMRYKPDSNVKYGSIGQINEKTQLMFGYYFFTSYWNYARKAMVEPQLLY